MLSWSVTSYPRTSARRSTTRCKSLRASARCFPYPHSSDVRGVSGLRELRPRRGRSPWRALYRQMGDIFVIAAVCPEAMVDEREFKKAGERALKRLEDLEEE
jgi:hypothetical protein